MPDLKLIEKFQIATGYDAKISEAYMTSTRKSLIKQTKLDEGFYGEEVWAACEALRARNEETALSKWLLSDRNTPCPTT